MFKHWTFIWLNDIIPKCHMQKMNWIKVIIHEVRKLYCGEKKVKLIKLKWVPNYFVFKVINVHFANEMKCWRENLDKEQNNEVEEKKECAFVQNVIGKKRNRKVFGLVICRIAYQKRREKWNYWII